jgi:hypothetical protein
MQSKVAEQLETALIAATQGLSPEQRLNAYLQHCRLVTQLYLVGQRQRADARTQP